MAAANPLEHLSPEDILLRVFLSSDPDLRIILDNSGARSCIKRVFSENMFDTMNWAGGLNAEINLLSRFIKIMRIICQTPEDYDYFGSNLDMITPILKLFQKSQDQDVHVVLFRLLESALLQISAQEFLDMAWRIYRSENMFLDYNIKQDAIDPVRDELIQTFKRVIVKHVNPSKIPKCDHVYIEGFLSAQRGSISNFFGITSSKSLDEWEKKKTLYPGELTNVESMNKKKEPECFGKKLSFLCYKTITGETRYHFWIQIYQCSITELEDCDFAFQSLDYDERRINNSCSPFERDRNYIIKNKEAAIKLYQQLCNALTLPVQMAIFEDDAQVIKGASFRSS
jgi:hypothetical protein